MQFKQASINNLAEISQFYSAVCLHQQLDQYGADWHWGDYPSRPLLAEKLQNEIVVEGLVDGQIASVGILTDGEDPNYCHVPWSLPSKKQETTVLHLFAVSPTFRGQGIAQRMLKKIFSLAKHHGYSVMHLDVLKGNVPAEKAYTKAGFQFTGEMVIHYQDIGDTTAHMFERSL